MRQRDTPAHENPPFLPFLRHGHQADVGQLGRKIFDGPAEIIITKAGWKLFDWKGNQLAGGGEVPFTPTGVALKTQADVADYLSDDKGGEKTDGRERAQDDVTEDVHAYFGCAGK